MPAMDKTLEESNVNKQGESTKEDICKRCRPVLTRYVDDFSKLTHQGSALKRRQRINPAPCLPDKQHYRDVKRQNDWLRQSMFDAMGNYLYCSRCITSVFGISSQRLARQCNVKRRQTSQPIREMKKSDVKEQLLGKYVVMPATCNQSFMVWWRSLASEAVVEVRYPHERHGLAGKPLIQQK